MNVKRTDTITFSKRELIQALKAAYGDTALPLAAADPASASTSLELDKSGFLTLSIIRGTGTEVAVKRD